MQPVHGNFAAWMPVGGAVGFSTKDATSGKFVPTSTSEFAAANQPIPSDIWGCQEPSGALANAVRAKNLAAAGSVAYQQAIAGWSRKAVGNAGAATAANFSNATMENVNANSIAFLVYSIFAQPTTGNSRVFWGAASINDLQSVSGSSVQRIRNGGSNANGALSHVGQVRPWLLVWDRTNSRNLLYSDIEKTSIAFNAGAAGATFEFLVGTTDATLTNQILAAWGWTGAAAESLSTDASAKSLLQALAWTVSGY